MVKRDFSVRARFRLLWASLSSFRSLPWVKCINSSLESPLSAPGFQERFVTLTFAAMDMVLAVDGGEVIPLRRQAAPRSSEDYQRP